jgi:hypothetical protein
MNRRNRREYAEALASLKRWDRQDRPEDWTAEEWRRLVGKAAIQKTAAPESARFPLLRPLVSAAAALIVLVGASLFLSKSRPADLSAHNEARPAEIAAPAAENPRPLPGTVQTESAGRIETTLPRTAASSESRALLASAARSIKPREDKPAFTWISPDTGLQIVWFTNNNLNLEDRQ